MEAITLITAIIILLITFWIYWNSDPKRKRMIREVNKIPGPFALPVIGNVLLGFKINRKNLFSFVDGITKTYWPIYRAWFGTTPEVNLSEADDIEVVLRSSVNIKKGMLYDFLHPWLGTGLLTSSGKSFSQIDKQYWNYSFENALFSGEKWHTHRKLLTPTFHFKILETFQEIFTRKSQILVKKLEEEVLKKEEFDVYPYITRCALDIICETAMGVELNAQENTHSPYVSAINDICELLVKRSFNILLYPDRIYYLTKNGRRFKDCLNTLHSFSNQVIKERKQQSIKRVDPEELSDDFGRKNRKAFLDLMLEASEGGTVLTDEEIREEVDTFMFEGHDTTTVSLCWALFLLGDNPDVQERVFEEQTSIFQDSDRLPNVQDLAKMKYLEQVIKEALRLYPSVCFITRTLVEDVQIGEYTIPAECDINVHIYHAHRNPKYFPDPDTFNPDNFLPERVQGRHPYAYVPFSAGPRNCIGQKYALQEEKTVLSTIIRHFRFRALEKPSEVQVFSTLVLRPQEGVKLTMERR